MADAIVPRNRQHGSRQLLQAIMAMIAGAGIQMARQEAERVAQEIAITLRSSRTHSRPIGRLGSRSRQPTIHELFKDHL